VLAMLSTVDSNDAAQQIARLQAAQTSYREDLDGLTLQEAMKRFHVSGMSIAVNEDFRIA
jgi:hypothetical protein